MHQATIPEPSIILTDKAGKITWFNEATTELCGYELSEIVGERPGAVLQGYDTDSDTVSEISTSLRHRSPFEGRILNYHKDGHSYWSQLTINHVYDRSELNKHLNGFVGVSSLISSERTAKEKRNGIITLCASCKKQKVGPNTWVPVEELIMQLTSCQISHGTCPECVQDFFD